VLGEGGSEEFLMDKGRTAIDLRVVYIGYSYSPLASLDGKLADVLVEGGECPLREVYALVYCEGHPGLGRGCVEKLVGSRAEGGSRARVISGLLEGQDRVFIRGKGLQERSVGLIVSISNVELEDSEVVPYMVSAGTGVLH
jgi:hypothetical protein